MDPTEIQEAIFKHFEGRFQESKPIRPAFSSQIFKKLSSEEVSFLEAPFSAVEIKSATWSCNGAKGPGPDGLNFNFVKKFWPLIGNSFIEAILHFEKFGRLGRGCNASFLSLVPKKSDPLEISDYGPISLL